MNNTDKLKKWIDANVWDGDDRAGCTSDHAAFNPDELQELFDDCFASLIEAKDKEIARLRESLKLIQELAGARSTDEYQMDACLCEIWYIADSAKPQKGTE